MYAKTEHSKSRSHFMHPHPDKLYTVLHRAKTKIVKPNVLEGLNKT